MGALDKLTIKEVIDNFDLFDEWEDKYVYLIDLGRKLPPMPDQEKCDLNKVHGCQAEVWVKLSPDTSEAPPRIHLMGDSNSTIVKGLVAIAILLFSGKSPEDIQKVDEKDAFQRLGLDQYLSPTRKVGLASMVKKIKSDSLTLG